MPAVGDRVLDLGLNVLDVEATHLNINTVEQSTYGGATSGATYLGTKNFGVGAVCGAPAAGAPNGRKVTTAAVTDGSVTTTGTAGAWSITDNTNLRLLAAGVLSASQGVTSGNTFTLPAFDIRLPSA